MAEVYLARAAGPMGFEKLVVLKRVLPHLAEEENFVTMFLSEARLVAQLNHPNVVQVFDFGEHLGVWFLVMELIDGPNLRALLKRAAERKEALPIALVARAISLAAEGLAYAHDFVEPHSGRHLELVHRDISPDNILLSRTGAVKVVDFGIAKVATQLHHTRTGMVRGKFSYMPPEQLQGDKLDRRADVYALGMCLYELLTGKKPFDTSVEAVVVRAVLYEQFTSAAQFRPELPPALLTILDKALAKRRDERYPDCRALQGDLERFIASQGEPVSQLDLAQLVQRLAGPSPWAGPVQPNLTPAELMTPSTVDRMVQVPPTPATVQVPEVAPPRPSAPPVGPYDTTEIGQPGFQPPRPSGPPPPPQTWSGPAPSTEPLPPSTWSGPAPQPTYTGPPPLPEPSWPQTNARPQARGAWLMVAAGLGAVLIGGVVTAAVVTATEKPPQPTKVVVRPATVDPPVKPPAPPPTPAPPPAAAVTPPPPPPPVVPPKPVERRNRPPAAPKGPLAQVEFRVRPFGTIYLDGKLLGDTPMEPVSVTVGKHALRIVNKELGREEKRTIDVPAKGLTVRHSFGE
ncbi:MAG: protein kinase [Myxococcales bacterium]|nr:protein kinase [Myxococcales bacterium]